KSLWFRRRKRREVGEQGLQFTFSVSVTTNFVMRPKIVKRHRMTSRVKSHFEKWLDLSRGVLEELKFLIAVFHCLRTPGPPPIAAIRPKWINLFTIRAGYWKVKCRTIGTPRV